MATDLRFVSLVQQHQHPSHGMWIWSTKQTSQSQGPYDDSWEVRAFAEDAKSLMGTTWPPRSYTCLFCQREFRSALALGGHMNLHRRDRARLNRMLPAGVEHPSLLMIPSVSNGGGLCVLYQFPSRNSIINPSNIRPCLDTSSTLLPISPRSSNNPNMQFPRNVYPNQLETPTSKPCKLNDKGSLARTKEPSATEELDLELRL